MQAKAIRQLAFSPLGRKLLAISDDDSVLKIFDWAQQILLNTIKVDSYRVLCCGFVNES